MIFTLQSWPFWSGLLGHGVISTVNPRQPTVHARTAPVASNLAGVADIACLSYSGRRLPCRWISDFGRHTRRSRLGGSAFENFLDGYTVMMSSVLDNGLFVSPFLSSEG